jgi:hypothetical protein
MGKTATDFRVALNPRNPEANSWYDTGTGVNLFLNKPESADLSRFNNDDLQAVARGIRTGLLIVSRGSVPEGLEINSVKHFASPRGRWSHDEIDNDEAANKRLGEEMKARMADAIKNHESAVGKAAS